MGFIIIGGIVLVVIIAILIIIVRRQKSEQVGSSESQTTDTTRARVKESVEEPDEMTKLCGNLADLMLKLRSSGVSQAVSDDVKDIIVPLTVLLPRFEERHKGSELMFVLGQIGKSYLPDLLNPFSEMSAEMKAQNEQKLRVSLASLKKEIDKVQGILDRGEVGRFETEAGFLRQKFLSESIEVSPTSIEA
ncbi:MAG: hypothetical protein Q7S53_00085 [bacterium]|nr:hypothetical protein [bacterium]